MFKNDIFIKRFLVVCVSVSMVMLSAGFLIQSAKPALASKAPVTPSGKISGSSGVEIYPMGISNGTCYWLEYTDKWYFNSKTTAEWR